MLILLSFCPRFFKNSLLRKKTLRFFFFNDYYYFSESLFFHYRQEVEMKCRTKKLNADTDIFK